VNASNNAINIAAGEHGDIINGNKDAIHEDPNDTISVDGSSDDLEGDSTDSANFYGGDYNDDTSNLDGPSITESSSNAAPPGDSFAGDGTGDGGSTGDGDGGDGDGDPGGDGDGDPDPGGDGDGDPDPDLGAPDFVGSGRTQILNDMRILATHGPSAGVGAAPTLLSRPGITGALGTALASADGTTTPSAVFEGAHWGSKVVTWSFGSGSQFTGPLSTGEKALVEKAMDTWSAASGLTFIEEADSPDVDIRVGPEKLDTPDTGLLGYTSFHSTGGTFQPGTIAAVEDPSESPLKTGTDGQLTYSGTQSEFYQVTLHEIGHALGLADNADPSSVMYYASGTTNRQLDATDIAEIRELYGTSGMAGQAVGSSVGPKKSQSNELTQDPALNRLIHAMAVFGAETGRIGSDSFNSTLAHDERTLAANSHI
jgi:hypothetical protein